MKALFIIDMQKISFTPDTPRLGAEGVIERINRLSDYFRNSGDPVIFIQHDGTEEGECIPGTSEWEILDELKVDPQDLIIGKTANDAFYHTNLEDELRKRGIEKLIITGSATDFCVDATVKSALVHDFDITIIADAHTAADRPHVTAEQVVAHYNWIWSEMTATKYKMKVKRLEEYLAD